MLWLILSVAFGAPITELQGSYAYPGGKDALARTENLAVEEVLNEMTGVARPFARKPLQQAAKSCERMSFEVSDTDFTVQCDDAPEFTRPFQGPWEQVTAPDGTVYSVSLTVVSDGVVLNFKGPDGKFKRVTYQVLDDAVRVTRMFGDRRIPAPVTWSVTYNRAQ